MENENLIGVYLKLLNVLECPVCLDYLTKPVAICHEGHALCSKCKLNISTCPLCRKTISSTRGLILDQIIETLLYPCYKMACGSLLKRSDAESHDLNCTLENAADKQAVLHNNLLKNIEENFGSFIVQPEVVKETRTVGTVTGKVKTADARVQTQIPFSSSLLLEKLNSAGCLSPLSGHPKTDLSTGISISSVEQSPDTSFKATDLSSLAFTFPQTSSFDQSALAFSMNPGGLNNTNMSSMFSYPQDSSIKFSLEPFQNNGCFSRDAATFNPSSRPFTFTYGSGNNSEEVSKNNSRKPSTNLNFTMGNSPSCRQPDQGASNEFFIRNQEIPLTFISSPSGDSINFSHLALSSSSPAPFSPKLSRDDFNLGNKTSKNKASTNLGSCSTFVNSAGGSNSQPFGTGDSLIAATERKRPTTNLAGMTTRA